MQLSAATEPLYTGMGVGRGGRVVKTPWNYQFDIFLLNF